MHEEIIPVTTDLIQSIVPPRLVSSKKGDNGIVLVIGGSGIYHGAPMLSILATLRSGVDLVYTAVPKLNIVPIRSFSPNVIVLPLPTDRFTIGCAIQQYSYDLKWVISKMYIPSVRLQPIYSIFSLYVHIIPYHF